MKKKGFTLIELLAVIVILAIIALIATPAVLNIIEDSRKSAAEASARNIMNAAKTYYMSETMNGRTPGDIDLSTNTLKYDGDQASKGGITFENGKPSGTMYIGGYCVTITINGNVTSEKKSEDECEITVTPSEPTIYTKYDDGTPLLYDPVNNVKCEAATSSATGTNDTCMKWYAFLDSENSSTVNLILDHNTTATVAWGNSGETTPTLANQQLATDVTNWNATVKSTARLISAEEVHQIAPSKSFTDNYGTVSGPWTQTGKAYEYHLHTGSLATSDGVSSKTKYGWLFDNTYGCTSYGCNQSQTDTWGYWTSSIASTDEAWEVSNLGKFATGTTTYDMYHGIRPVIAVSKTVFE